MKTLIKFGGRGGDRWVNIKAVISKNAGGGEGFSTATRTQRDGEFPRIDKQERKNWEATSGFSRK